MRKARNLEHHPNVKKEAQELLKGEKQRKTPCDIMNEAMPKNERERERARSSLQYCH